MPDKTTPHIQRAAQAICEVDCGRVTPNELARCEGLAKAAFLTTQEPSEAEISAARDALANFEIADWRTASSPAKWDDMAKVALVAAARVRLGK